MKKLVFSLPIISLFALAPSGLALANPNPSGTGQPGQDCVALVEAGGTEPGNGHAAVSPGSPFNEPELTGGPGGKGGQAYNAAGAPAQYDVACYQATQHALR